MNKINFIKNHDTESAISDIVDCNGGFKFRDNVKKEDHIKILNWMERQGVKILVK